MEDVISQTKAEFTRAKERMVQVLATTPDDKINWSPSPTARTPIQLVAHGAMSIAGIQRLLDGQPFPFSGAAEMDATLRAAEREYTSREPVLGLLERNSTEYLAWLDALTPERLASTVQFPFGPTPIMAVAITFPGYHLQSHIAQIDYIQTIYGDYDWHM